MWKEIGLLLLSGCSTASVAQTPTPAQGKVLISTDCRNPTTDTVEWKENVTISLAKNETRCLWVKNESAKCVEVNANSAESPVLVKLFQPTETKITTQSGISTKTSTYYDVLNPVASGYAPSGTSLLDLSALSNSVTGSTVLKVSNASITLNVLPIIMQPISSIPLMMAGINSMCIRALMGKELPNKIAPETHCTNLISKTYADHRITPYASEVIFPPIKNGMLDLDALPFAGMNAKDTWIKNAHPNFINIPNPSFGQRISVDYLKAAEATIKAQGWKGKAWIYAKDEPHSDADYALLKQILTDIRTNAPSLKTMVTCKPRADLEGLIDVYTINNVFEPFQVPQNGWIYTACDAHGCGSGDRRNGISVQIGPGSSRPDYGSLDRSSVFSRSFAWSIFKFKANAGLYYNSMEWTNLLPSINYSTDQRNFGSYGDGALIFPNADGTVGVAHRLKIIRESMFDLEYLTQMNTDERKEFDAIFISNSDFSKDYGRYQALRDRIAIRIAENNGGTGSNSQLNSPSPSPGAQQNSTSDVEGFKCTKKEVSAGFTIDCRK